MSYKSNLWKIYLFTFFFNLHFIGGVLIPFFTDWGGLSFFQIMILQSWFMLWIFLLELPTGTIADYFGRKQSLILAAGFGIIAVIVYTSTPNFYIFLIAEVLFALSVSLLSGADHAFVYDTLKKIQKAELSKKIFGRLESCHLAGIMIAAPIGSLIASQVSLRAPMLFMALPLLLAVLIGLTLKEPKMTEKVKSQRYLTILKSGVNFFRRHQPLKILAVDMIVIAAVAYFIIWLYQPMLQRAGVSIAYFGLVHAILVAAQILLMNNYQRLEKFLKSKKRLIFLSAFLTGFALIIGGLTNWLPIVILVIIIGGGFGLGRKPLFTSYFNKYIPSAQRATVLSSISMFRHFVLIILSPLVGYFVDWSLSYTLITLGLIAVIFSFISKVKEEHLID